MHCRGFVSLRLCCWYKCSAWGCQKGLRVTLLLQAELDRFVNALISIREEVRDIENGKLDR